ncbi:MAG TPA: GNAT family N-acetyltransferase, partial [Luteitalea sp.]|nr:GNAT family N-acetyltransferase [Luteitalea sp.]
WWGPVPGPRIRVVYLHPRMIVPAAEVTFRELTSVEDIRLVQDMERRVWAYEDIDLSPVPLIIALVKSGALLLGAFERGVLRGFALSVPGDRHGQRVHWSHMTGVDVTLRGSGLGTRLKREQARRVAARGYRRIQWTYDPLQSLNAYLNLVKLGGRSGEYAEHVYGDSTSALHRGAPTDRFVVTWDLTDDGTPMPSTRVGRADAATAIDAGRCGSRDGWDTYEPADTLPDAEVVRVPVPARFSAMLRDAPALATDWRMATRAQFQDLFARGYEAVSFTRNGERGSYLLVR